jgi:hypothetical protein
VREFVPTEGDLIDKIWSDRGIVKTHPLPAYAVVDVDKAAQARKQYIQEHVGAYFNALIDKKEPLIWNTYVMAFQQSQKAFASSRIYT